MAKIPGVQYQSRPRGSLTGRDISAPLKVAAAQTQAAKAVGDMAQDYYNNVSTAESTEAKLNYTKQIGSIQQEALRMRKEGQMSTEDIATWAEAQLSEARTTAEGNLTTPLSQSMFADQANAMDVQTKTQWGATQFAWAQEDAIAAGITDINASLDAGDIIGANQAYSKIENMLSPQARANEFGRIKNTEAILSFKAETMMAMAGGATAVEMLREDIKNSEYNDNVKKAANDYLISEMIRVEGEGFSTPLVEIDKEQGSVAAAIAAEEAREVWVRETNADFLGLSETEYQTVLNHINQITARYRANAEGNLKRGAKLSQLDNLTLVSRDYDYVPWNERFQVKYMGYGVNKNGTVGYEYGVAPLSAAQFLENPEILMAATGEMIDKGIMAKDFENILNAALVKPQAFGGLTDAQVLNAVHAFRTIANADSSVLNNSQGGKAFNEIHAMSLAAGGAEPNWLAGVDMYRRLQAIEPEQRKIYQEQANSKEFATAFEDGFEDTLKANMPVKSQFWFDSAPEVKRNYRNNVQMLTEKYLPVFDGDVNRAMNAAVLQTANTFGVSYADGEATLMQFPPSKMVQSEVGSPIEPGDWERQQPLQDLKTVFAQQGWELEEDNVTMVAAPVQTGDKPLYYIRYDHPETGLPTLLPFQYDYDSTAIGKKQKAERMEQQEQARNTAALERGAAMVESNMVVHEMDPTDIPEETREGRPYPSEVYKYKKAVRDRQREIDETEMEIELPDGTVKIKVGDAKAYSEGKAMRETKKKVAQTAAAVPGTIVEAFDIFGLVGDD